MRLHYRADLLPHAIHWTPLLLVVATKARPAINKRKQVAKLAAALIESAVAALLTM
jgi:hypothetical protein